MHEVALQMLTCAVGLAEFTWIMQIRVHPYLLGISFFHLCERLRQVMTC